MSEHTSKSLESSTYTSFEGWYANEQEHWTLPDNHREIRRKRRLANLTGQLGSAPTQQAISHSNETTPAHDTLADSTPRHITGSNEQSRKTEIIHFTAETFEAARQVPNSLPDFVVDEVIKTEGNINLYTFVEPDESDLAITKQQAEDYYYKDMKSLHAEFARTIDGRSTFIPHFVFSQFDTPQFAKRRAAGEQIQVTDRIYLNPKQTDRLAIYKEFLERADEQDLAVRSKVYASMSGTKGSLAGLRQDAIVIYAAPENRDETLALVQDIYQNHQESFEGRTSTPQTCELAPGLAVGSEPVKFTGQESLTSIRVKILNAAYEQVIKTCKKKDITLTAEQLHRNVRRYAEIYMQRNNIDTHNWSFDNNQ